MSWDWIKSVLAFLPNAYISFYQNVVFVRKIHNLFYTYYTTLLYYNFVIDFPSLSNADFKSFQMLYKSMPFRP